MRTAAEAVIELFFGNHRERWGFLVVEGAAGFVFAAGFFQWHTTANQFDQISACDQVVDKVLGNAPGHSSKFTRSAGTADALLAIEPLFKRGAP